MTALVAIHDADGRFEPIVPEDDPICKQWLFQTFFVGDAKDRGNDEWAWGLEPLLERVEAEWSKQVESDEEGGSSGDERRKAGHGMPEPARHSGEQTETAIPGEIKELERTTPPLHCDDGQWVNNKRAAKLEGIKTESLAKYRKEGIKNADHTLGRDTKGRIWRRGGTQHSHPWYLRSSLLSESSDSE